MIGLLSMDTAALPISQQLRRAMIGLGRMRDAGELASLPDDTLAELTSLQLFLLFITDSVRVLEEKEARETFEARVALIEREVLA